VAAVLVAGALVGCRSSAIRTAPFRERPDSVNPGDLRGPFDGRVVDAASGQAVAGALVYATWSYQRGYGLNQPAGSREFVTSTDAQGFYKIPRVSAEPSKDKPVPEDARLTSFYLVIYKRGFVAYRSDRRFSDLGPRHDFAQTHNRVRLERWRAELSHTRHLRYVGGGPALASLTAWEAAEAADELAGRGGKQISSDLVLRRGANVVAAKLLNDKQIKAITGYDGEFETGPLGDTPDTTQYSSQHFKALGRAESYDVAVRLWKLDPGAAQQRYQSFVDSLPRVRETNEIANRSLRALEGSITGIAFLDGQRGVVLLLTCGGSQCADSDVAAKLGKVMYERIKKLWPLQGVGR
jgi:hypothetical protein